MRTFAEVTAAIITLIILSVLAETAPAAAVALLAVIFAWLVACWWIGSRRISNGIKARRLADAEKQHAALMEGHENLGIYGRYQPERLDPNEYGPIRPGGQVIVPKIEWVDPPRQTSTGTP